MSKTIILKSLGLSILLSLAANVSLAENGGSGTGGGYAYDNSIRILADAKKACVDQFQWVSKDVFASHSIDKDTFLNILNSMRVNMDKSLTRSRFPGWPAEPLMFNYGSDANGPYIEVTKSFFDSYADVSKEMEPLIINDVEAKIIHEITHDFGVGVNNDSDSAVLADVLLKAAQAPLGSNLPRQKEISADYIGTMTSKLDNSLVGGATLKLRSYLALQQSADGSTQMKNILSGEFTYSGFVGVTVYFDNAFFDPASGKFQVRIPVEDNSGQMQNIDLDGTIQDDTFIGDIYSEASPDMGMHMNLKIGTGLPNPAMDPNCKRGAQFIDDANFQGQYSIKGSDGATANYKFTLSLSSMVMTDKPRLLDVLSAERFVNASVDIGIGIAPIIFDSSSVTGISPVKINDHAHTLGGSTLFQYQSQGSPYLATLNCTQETENQQAGWKCFFNVGVKEIQVFLTRVNHW